MIQIGWVNGASRINLNPRTLAKIKDSTINRCEMIAISSELMVDFAAVSTEQLHLLYDVSAINFPIYLQIDDILIEYIRPEEFSRSLLQNILSAMTKPGDNVGIFVQEAHKNSLLRLQSSVRKRKSTSYLLIIRRWIKGSWRCSTR